jgi:hypothetical protein
LEVIEFSLAMAVESGMKEGSQKKKKNTKTKDKKSC